MSPAVLTLLAEARRAEARGQFLQWELMLRYRDERSSLIEAGDSPAITNRLEKSAIATELAITQHLAEARVWRILQQGDRVRHCAPTVWQAFGDGDLHAEHVSLIASALDKLTEDRSHAVVDANAVQYAISHTVGELKAWLKRMVARLEPEEAEEAADRAREQRQVHIRHDEDGMSWLSAFLPTPVAVAVGNRLRKAAKTMDDDRTLDQKRADLVAHWLTCSEGTRTEITAEIAVTVPLEALAGLTAAPMVTEDGEPAPASWLRELLDTGNPFWTRLLTDERGRVLDRTFLGYQPPESLREAVRWRDGTCRLKGCTKRASECDLDHVTPWDHGGDTTASNLRTLCRRHHGMKGHGLLDDTVYEEPRPVRERYVIRRADPDHAR